MRDARGDVVEGEGSAVCTAVKEHWLMDSCITQLAIEAYHTELTTKLFISILVTCMCCFADFD